MARGDPEITANDPGAIYDPGHISSHGDLIGAGWRMPNDTEKAQASYQAAYDALSPDIKAKIASGQLIIDPIVINTGTSHDSMPTESGIRALLAPGPNNTMLVYDLSGKLTGSYERGGGGGFLGDVVGAISNAVSSVGGAVENAVNAVGKTVEAIIQNPLPVIETVALVVAGVPPPVASAVVTAMNGGDITAIVTNAAAVYVGGQVGTEVTNAIAPVNEVSAFPTSGIVGNVPAAATATDMNTVLIKAAASAAGADATATTAALVSGKSFDQALQIGTNAAVSSLASSAGQAVGSEVASNIEDPTLANIANKAVSAGTTAGLTGGDIGKAVTGAAQQDVLNAAGDVIGANLPELSGGPNIDLSGVKEAIKPISDVATKIAQPISDVATQVLQPAEKPIKEAAQTASDVATQVLQPAEKPIKETLQAAGETISSATKPVGEALSSVADTAKSVTSDVASKVPAGSLDKSIIDLMAQAPKVNQPAVSNVAAGGEGSAASYGGADVAMLGDTSQAGLGSKVSKKGGKYPWGEPEGTTALKEGLGV